MLLHSAWLAAGCAQNVIAEKNPTGHATQHDPVKPLIVGAGPGATVGAGVASVGAGVASVGAGVGSAVAHTPSAHVLFSIHVPL